MMQTTLKVRKVREGDDICVCASPTGQGHTHIDVQNTNYYNHNQQLK